VSAERQPFVELAMMDEQNLRVVNDENRDGEINFFVEVRHALPENFNNKAATAQSEGPKIFFASLRLRC
jgi:hypothetical protein